MNREELKLVTIISFEFFRKMTENMQAQANNDKANIVPLQVKSNSNYDKLKYNNHIQIMQILDSPKINPNMMSIVGNVVAQSQESYKTVYQVNKY